MRGGGTPEEEAVRVKIMADYEARAREIKKLKAERANVAREADTARAEAERLRREADAAAAAPLREGSLYTPEQLEYRVNKVFTDKDAQVVVMAALRGGPINRKDTIKIHPDTCSVSDDKYNPICGNLFALFGDADDKGNRKIENLAAAEVLFREIKPPPPPRKSAPASTAGRRRRSRKTRRHARHIR